MEKKTVIYQEVDGHKIIKGFSNPAIDPVATSKVVDGLITETQEFKDVQAQKDLHTGGEAKKFKAKRAVSQKVNAKLKADKNLTRDNVLEHLDITLEKYEYDVALEAMKQAQRHIKPLALVLNAKLMRMRVEHAIYFEPRPGETIVDGESIEPLRQAIADSVPGTFVALDGIIVHDNRGAVYFKKVNGKWTQTKILRLGDGVPKGAVTSPTDAQSLEIDRDRVLGLTSTERALERTQAMDEVMKTSEALRSRLEIQSDTGALSKSRAEYEAGVAGVKKLYD